MQYNGKRNTNGVFDKRVICVRAGKRLDSTQLEMTALPTATSDYVPLTTNSGKVKSNKQYTYNQSPHPLTNKNFESKGYDFTKANSTKHFPDKIAYWLPTKPPCPRIDYVRTFVACPPPQVFVFC